MLHRLVQNEYFCEIRHLKLSEANVKSTKRLNEVVKRIFNVFLDDDKNQLISCSMFLVSTANSRLYIQTLRNENFYTVLFHIYCILAVFYLFIHFFFHFLAERSVLNAKKMTSHEFRMKRLPKFDKRSRKAQLRKVFALFSSFQKKNDSLLSENVNFLCFKRQYLQGSFSFREKAFLRQE